MWHPMRKKNWPLWSHVPSLGRKEDGRRSFSVLLMGRDGWVPCKESACLFLPMSVRASSKWFPELRCDFTSATKLTVRIITTTPKQDQTLWWVRTLIWCSESGGERMVKDGTVGRTPGQSIFIESFYTGPLTPITILKYVPYEKIPKSIH